MKLLDWAVPLGFGAALCLVAPLKTALQFGSDEGFELMKALLVSHGHPLYGEIWNDQPPLHTELLALLFRVLGPSAYVGRLLSVAFAMVLVGSLYRLVSDRSGRVAGLLSVVLLISSASFLQLSVSVMLELPAMALALAAVWATAKYCATGTRRWLVLSGILFGCALQVKFTAIIFLPALAADYRFYHLSKRRKTLQPSEVAAVAGGRTAAVCQAPAAVTPQSTRPENIQPPSQVGRAAGGLCDTAAVRSKTGIVASCGVWRGAAVWSVAALASFGLIVALFYRWNTFAVAWASHFSAGTSRAAGMASASYGFRPESLLNNLALAVPAAAGLLVAGCLRRRDLLFPVVLFLTALAIHLWHRPYWHYYDLHFAIPLAWLGAAGIIEWFRFLWQRGIGASLLSKLRLGAGLLAWSAVVSLVVTMAPEQIWNEALRLTAALPVSQNETVAVLRQHAPQTRWVFTERRVEAFWAGLPIPPELAVIPSKRLWSGQIAHNAIIQSLDRYRPEMILLGSDKLAQFGLDQYLQDHYRASPTNVSADLYLRK